MTESAPIDYSDYTYKAGLKIAIDEAQILLNRQHESVEALNDKARSILGATSMILSLVGSLELIALAQRGGPQNAIFGFIFAGAIFLYAGLVLLTAWIQHPIALKGPISPEWDIISVQYARLSEVEMYKQQLSDLLNAISDNSPVIERKKKIAVGASWLLPLIVGLLLIVPLLFE